MRKIIRNMLRKQAEKMGVKPSRFVADNFDKYQVDKYGKTRRRINQAKGTRARRTWKQRIADVV